MRDLRKYWQEVRALETRLPEFVWLMSVEDAVMAEVAAHRAAQLLLAKSHRLATEDEIAEMRAKLKQAKRDAVHAGLRRRGIAVVEVK